jgi:hypothetical protein
MGVLTWLISLALMVWHAVIAAIVYVACAGFSVGWGAKGNPDRLAAGDAFNRIGVSCALVDAGLLLVDCDGTRATAFLAHVGLELASAIQMGARSRRWRS